MQQNLNNQHIWSKDIPVEKSSYLWTKEPIIIQRPQTLNQTRPQVVELFSGCGGTSTGFSQAGYEIALGLDMLEPAAKTFARNHTKATTILGDIKTISPQMLADHLTKSVDVLIAGIPCQGFSLNNRKRNDADERNFLYEELLKHVSYLEPKMVVIENVSGIRSSSNGAVVEKIISGLSEAGNMTVSHGLLDAADYGVPQKRRRYVFIGIRGKYGFDFSDIIKTHGPSTNNKYVDIHSAIGDLPSLNAGQSSEEYLCTPMTEYQHLMRKNAPQKLHNHEAPNHPEETIIKIAATRPGQPIYPRFKQRIRLDWSGLSPTQVSGGIRPQFQFGHPQDNRGLTIRERCRIQSFPDSFIVEGGIVQGRVQTGNAVPPLLAKAIGSALKKYI
jgi:DNA (cytosine-5)-methyltransferase 1